MAETTSPIDASSHEQQSTAELVHAVVVNWLQTEAGLKVDQVDPDASLFALGIDSLGAATIGSELEQATQKKLDPEVVYELETIHELSEYLDGLPTQPVFETEPCPVKPLPETISPNVAAPTSSDTAEDPILHYERMNRRVQVAQGSTGCTSSNPRSRHTTGPGWSPTASGC